MKKKILFSVLSLSSSILIAAEATPTLEERVDQLETASYFHSLEWNGQFEYRYDSIHDKDDSSGNSYSPMRLKVLLDASTHADPKIQFYTRFGLTKFTNDVVNQSPSNPDSFSATREEKGVAMTLERAYINYNIFNDLALTAGRLPTIDGTPTDMWDNTSRQGTYPLLSYGAILDGVALSYNWGALPEQYKLATRFIYTPLYNTSEDGSVFGNIAKPTYDGGQGPNLQEKATLYSVMLDFSTKAIPVFSDFSFIAQGVFSKDIHTADTIARGTDLGAVLANPAFGGTGIPTASGVKFLGSTNRWNFDLLIANTTLRNIAESNVSFGFTFLHTSIESKGFIESNATAINTGVTNTAGAAAAGALAKKLGIGKGIMTDSNEDGVEGSILLATLVYVTPFTSIKTPLVGVEYLHGSRGAQYFGFATDSLTNFYATRGNAYHIFWSQPLTTGTNFRVGFMKQDHDYTKGYIGAPTESHLKENTVYGNFRYTF